MRGRGPVIKMHLIHLLITPFLHFLSAKRCLAMTACVTSLCSFLQYFLKKREKTTNNKTSMIQAILFHFEKYMNGIHEATFCSFLLKDKEIERLGMKPSLELVLQNNRRIAAHSLLSCLVEENSYLILISHPGFFNDVVWKWMNKGPLDSCCCES